MLRVLALMIGVMTGFAGVSKVEAEPVKLVASCATTNDLYVALKGSGVDISRFDTPADAIAAAPAGAGVLILADGYPEQTTAVDAATLDMAREKGLRLYIEFPGSLPGVAIDKPRGIDWQRVIVTSNDFGPELKKMRLLIINGCRFVPMKADNPKLVLGRVAGFDTAVFGLPKETFPILFEMPGQTKMLVSTTKLSRFITARYAPISAWKPVWQYVLGWLGDAEAGKRLQWTPTVAPSYTADEKLPENAELLAIQRGAAWFSNAKLFVDPSWQDQYDKAWKWGDRVGPHDLNAKLGDGSSGMLEGISSSISPSGIQPYRWYIRADCNGEAGMAMALAGKVLNKPYYLAIARNLNQFLYQTSIIAAGERRDPHSAAGGLVGWSNLMHGPGGGNDEVKIFYGDDNARTMLGTIGSSAALGSDQWDEPLARCLLGNLRTTGRLGFRGNAISQDDLIAQGWKKYFDRSLRNFAPHFESWLWACDLWAYDRTGEKLFLQRAEAGIRSMMSAYPDEWHWTNGLQQERGRMLLPLAWLVRVDDTAEHRAWLDRIATDLLANQDACGAIREEIGSRGHGMFAPPGSNEAYGTSESPLIQENGDPVSDLLYTTNFTFLGLHEAAAATGEKRLIDASNKLAQYLCRIQIRSASHPELDGGWFRAFDFHRWEYWASNSDIGWGVWSIESGWTQSWVVSVLAMRQLHTSLWEISEQTEIRKPMEELRPIMIPDSALADSRQQVHHAAIGAGITLQNPPSQDYYSDGPKSLVDGILASADDLGSGWLGFLGTDMIATIDLGKPIKITTISARFLQLQHEGIFYPSSVLFEGSTDGKTFQKLGEEKIDGQKKDDANIIRTTSCHPDAIEARYVRVTAKSIKTIPNWHWNAPGKPAWSFVDEIMINPDHQ